MTKRRTPPGNEQVYRKKAGDSAGGEAYRALLSKVRRQPLPEPTK
jgi:hypothetical protein